MKVTQIKFTIVVPMDNKASMQVEWTTLLEKDAQGKPDKVSDAIVAANKIAGKIGAPDPLPEMLCTTTEVMNNLKEVLA